MRGSTGRLALPGYLRRAQRRHHRWFRSPGHGRSHGGWGRLPRRGGLREFTLSRLDLSLPLELAEIIPQRKRRGGAALLRRAPPTVLGCPGLRLRLDPGSAELHGDAVGLPIVRSPGVGLPPRIGSTGQILGQLGKPDRRRDGPALHGFTGPVPSGGGVLCLRGPSWLILRISPGDPEFPGVVRPCGRRRHRIPRGRRRRLHRGRSRWAGHPGWRRHRRGRRRRLRTPRRRRRDRGCCPRRRSRSPRRRRRHRGRRRLVGHRWWCLRRRWSRLHSRRRRRRRRLHSRRHRGRLSRGRPGWGRRWRNRDLDRARLLRLVARHLAMGWHFEEGRVLGSARPDSRRRFVRHRRSRLRRGGRLLLGGGGLHRSGFFGRELGSGQVRHAGSGIGGGEPQLLREAGRRGREHLFGKGIKLRRRRIRRHRRPEDRGVVGPTLLRAYPFGPRRFGHAADLILQPVPEPDTTRKCPGDRRRLPIQLHHVEDLLGRGPPGPLEETREASSLRILVRQEVHLEYPVILPPRPVARDGFVRNGSEGRESLEKLFSLHAKTIPISSVRVQPEGCSVREKVDAAELRPL